MRSERTFYYKRTFKDWLIWFKDNWLVPLLLIAFLVWAIVASVLKAIALYGDSSEAPEVNNSAIVFHQISSGVDTVSFEGSYLERLTIVMLISPARGLGNNDAAAVRSFLLESTRSLHWTGKILESRSAKQLEGVSGSGDADTKSQVNKPLGIGI